MFRTDLTSSTIFKFEIQQIGYLPAFMDVVKEINLLYEFYNWFFHNKNNIMIPSIRSSLGSHHTSMPSLEMEPALDSARIEKYLEYFKAIFRQHLKERKF